MDTSAPAAAVTAEASASAAASTEPSAAPDASTAASSSSAAASDDLAGGVAGLSLDERFDLLMSIGEECIQPDELKRLLQNKPVPICYDGFEPSGRMHIAQVRRELNALLSTVITSDRMFNSGRSIQEDTFCFQEEFLDRNFGFQLTSLPKFMSAV